MNKTNGVRILTIVAVAVLGCLATVVWYNTMTGHANEVSFGRMEERVSSIESGVAQIPEMRDSIGRIEGDIRLILQKLEASP